MVKSAMKQAASGAQMDAFTRGRIIGQWEMGAKPSEIITRVRKTDNRAPKVDPVRKTIRKHREDARDTRFPREFIKDAPKDARIPEEFMKTPRKTRVFLGNS